MTHTSKALEFLEAAVEDEEMSPAFRGWEALVGIGHALLAIQNELEAITAELATARLEKADE